MKDARPWAGYAWSVAAVAACTAAGFAMARRFDLVNIAMVYLLAVVVIAMRYSRGAAVATAVLSVAAFDVLFVPPRGTFTVDDAQYLLTFAIMLAVALVISGLRASVHREASRRAELALQAETERIRSTLLASISHDLRTPLAVLSGASSSLAERGESLPATERAALARSLFERSREVSEHVAKVLEMTRLESGAIELQRDWCSIAEIAGAVLARLRESLASHHVLVEMPADLPLVRVDAGLIGQALGNLLENAARHTPPGTAVWLRVTLGEGELLVSVEDFARDLPEADLERIFAKFERGLAGDRGGGMGLGLAICRAIVTLHGGRAWAERVVGAGTAFRFTLPVEKQPEVPREAVS